MGNISLAQMAERVTMRLHRWRHPRTHTTSLASLCSIQWLTFSLSMQHNHRPIMLAPTATKPSQWLLTLGSCTSSPLLHWLRIKPWFSNHHSLARARSEVKARASKRSSKRPARSPRKWSRQRSSARSTFGSSSARRTSPSVTSNQKKHQVKLTLLL